MRTNASINYQETVRRCVLELIEQGGQTVKDVAEKCGFKETHNLRKQLNSMVANGVLQSTMAYTERGNMAMYYHKPVPLVTDSQIALPF